MPTNFKVFFNKKPLVAVLAILLFFIATSCQTVKPYQRSYLNDSSMQMGASKLAEQGSYTQMIREGATGGGGKNSGGCGCN